MTDGRVTGIKLRELFRGGFCIWGFNTDFNHSDGERILCKDSVKFKLIGTD